VVRKIPPSVCPVCGTDVPRDAKACPECGADERSGWDEEATRYDGLDLPDSAFEKAPRHYRKAKSSYRGGWWMVVGIVLLIALVFALVL
jgi:hypothetical protein